MGEGEGSLATSKQIRHGKALDTTTLSCPKRVPASEIYVVQLRQRDALFASGVEVPWIEPLFKGTFA